MRNKILLATLAILAAIVIGTVVFLQLMDFNQYRDLITTKVERATGRKLEIRGDLTLGILLRPTLAVSDLWFENSGWGSRPEMAKIGRLETRIALLPLIFGEIHILRITLIDADLLLETDANGQGNWLFPGGKKSQETQLPLITGLAIKNLFVTWRNGATGQSTKIHLDRLSLHTEETNAPFQLELIGKLYDKSLKSSFQLSGQPSDIRIDGLIAKLGKSNLSGQLNLSAGKGKRPRLQGELHIGQLDLTQFRSDEPIQETEDKDRYLFSRDPLPLAALQSLDADIRLQGDKIITDRMALTHLDTNIALSNGVLSIKPLKMKMADAWTNGELQLNTTPPRLTLQLSAKGLELGKLIHSESDNDILSGKADLSVNLKGKGTSVAAIMASLNGYTRLLTGPGTLKTAALDYLIGGLSKVVGTLVAKKSDGTVMNCLASDFEIKNGIATSRVLLMDTEFSTVVGDGTIDLRNEQLDLLIKPEPKSATLNVAVPVEIGGTLANPTFTPEKIATARKIAGVLGLIGGVAFPPAALLSLVEMGTGEENPCLHIAKRGTKAQGKAEAPSSKEGGVKKTLEGIGSKLKGLFGGD